MTSGAWRKDTPYGVYDSDRNEGWVSIGIDHTTAAFAVGTLRRWWFTMGRAAYPHATRLLITADGGGSNGYRTRAWKAELQQLADEIGLAISVCHDPPGASKWNPIEHRLFSFISITWRAQPLVSYAVILNLIGTTTTQTGLTVRCAVDDTCYPTGVTITDQEMAAIRLLPDPFHGEWNYTILPRTSPPDHSIP